MSPASSSIIMLSGPWLNYQYPSKWEFDDDFMGVHFQGRNHDDHIWSSQCTFWSEAISLYAQQLLHECPYNYNRLSFTSRDIVVAHTRSNRMEPWCIRDILKWLKYHQHRIETVSEIEQQYETLNGRTKHSASNVTSNPAASTNPNVSATQKGNESILSVSGVSSMFSSMIQYVTASGSHSETDDESDCDGDGDRVRVPNDPATAIRLDDDSKVVYVPLMEELCGKMANLNFYSKSPRESDLSQLIEIGTIRFESKPNEFIINGLVFCRFCTEVLRMTLCDVMVLKKWLIVQGLIKLFYLGDIPSMNESDLVESFTTEILNPTLSAHTVHELKDEMIYFNASSSGIDKEQMAKMQLLSIQMTMKRLSFQKSENETNLNLLNQQLMAKLQSVPSSKRRAVLQHHTVLLKKKKWLKQRIHRLDGSLFNLETTLNSMEDLTINKMVFEEMKNADKMLKSILETVPSVEDIEEMKEDIQESMDITNDIGQCLAKPMDEDLDGIDVDEEELLREYEQMEMENTTETLPEVPCHDIVVEEKEQNDGDIDIEGGKEQDKVKEVILVD